mmetsp:Transcript_15962/g.50905  ORF Transcript_15962/g.50905 Transcript_15962/m.50905 type:complete len:531 (+) Transcript_15962:1102-2694(+)
MAESCFSGSPEAVRSNGSKPLRSCALAARLLGFESHVKVVNGAANVPLEGLQRLLEHSMVRFVRWRLGHGERHVQLLEHPGADVRQVELAGAGRRGRAVLRVRGDGGRPLDLGRHVKHRRGLTAGHHDLGVSRHALHGTNVDARPQASGLNRGSHRGQARLELGLGDGGHVALLPGRAVRVPCRVGPRRVDGLDRAASLGDLGGLGVRGRAQQRLLLLGVLGAKVAVPLLLGLVEQLDLVLVQLHLVALFLALAALLGEAGHAFLLLLLAPLLLLVLALLALGLALPVVLLAPVLEGLLDAGIAGLLLPLYAALALLLDLLQHLALLLALLVPVHAPALARLLEGGGVLAALLLLDRLQLLLHARVLAQGVLVGAVDLEQGHEVGLGLLEVARLGARLGPPVEALHAVLAHILELGAVPVELLQRAAGALGRHHPALEADLGRGLVELQRHQQADLRLLQALLKGGRLEVGERLEHIDALLVELDGLLVGALLELSVAGGLAALGAGQPLGGGPALALAVVVRVQHRLRV